MKQHKQNTTISKAQIRKNTGSKKNRNIRQEDTSPIHTVICMQGSWANSPTPCVKV